MRIAQRRSKWTLADPDPDNLFDGALVYDKGGMVLHLLSEYLGHERFLEASRYYLQRHAGGNASTEDMEAAFSEASGEDLKPFFDAWVRSNAIPEISAKSRVQKQGGRWKTTIELSQKRAPVWHPLSVDVELVSADETQSKIVRVPFESSKVKVEATVDFKPAQVLVDPRRELPIKLDD